MHEVLIFASQLDAENEGEAVSWEGAEPQVYGGQRPAPPDASGGDTLVTLDGHERLVWHDDEVWLRHGL